MIVKQKILAFLLLLLTVHEIGAKLTQLKMLKSIGNAYTYENIHRSEDLAYPGKDSESLRKLQEMWNDYYNCLQKNEKHQTKPQLHRILQGQNTEFQCDFCPRPFQNYEEIEWKYKPLSPESNINELDYLDLTPEMSLTSTKALQIFNAVESFAGLYACYKKKNVLSIHILEVSENDATEKVEQLQTNENKFERMGYNFYVHYLWTDYTECSICGNIGRKLKYGTCYVAPNPIRAKKSVSRKSRLRQARSFMKAENASSVANNQNFSPEIVEKFQDGVPCASPYLPKYALSFSRNYTPVKVMVKYCWQPCEENKVFEVVDNFGKVVELANNSAGIYSLFQKFPNVPTGIERATEVGEFGSTVTIQCPGTSLTNTPVVWKVNNKIIFPETVSNSSNGRFTIDYVNRIHIKRLRLKDSRIFSCWQRGKLVGTVHLNVEKKFKIGFNHHVTLIGIIAIIVTFLLVGSKIITRELQMRKK